MGVYARLGRRDVHQGSRPPCLTAPPCSRHPQVFVPETPKPTRSLWGDDLPSATASTASAEKAATDFSDKLASTIGYGGAGAAAAGSGAAGRAAAAAAVVPEWWVPPNTAVYVPAGRREELQQQVRAGWGLGRVLRGVCVCARAGVGVLRW